MSFGSKVFLALGSVLTVASSSTVAIDVSVATDKSSYHPGEAMYISVTAYNPGSEDVMLYFGSTLQAQYTLDGFTAPEWGSSVLTSAFVPAHGSKVWTFRHDWGYNYLPFGPHNVQGNVVGYGASGLVSFSVTAPMLPTDSFLVDFDTLPHEKQQVTSLEEYWPWGVHFGTFGGGSVGIYESDGNGFAESGGRTTYPPGFNIVVQFDMPVYGVTAHVSTAAGYQVTMVARDAARAILGSVTSPPVPAYEEFVGPLRIRSDYPIASLEYWPSIMNACVLIDDVYLSLVHCVPADFELDGDVDLRNFGTFQTSFSGPNQPPPTDWDEAADLDGDTDVDFTDFLLFQDCFNGPNQPSDCE